MHRTTVKKPSDYYYSSMRLMLTSLTFSISLIIVSLSLSTAPDYMKVILACTSGPIMLASALSVYMEDRYGRHNLSYLINRVIQSVVVGVVFRYGSEDASVGQQLVFIYLLVFGTYLPRAANLARVLVGIIVMSASYKNSQVYWVVGLTNVDSLIEVAMLFCQWQGKLQDKKENQEKGFDLREINGGDFGVLRKSEKIENLNKKKGQKLRFDNKEVPGNTFRDLKNGEDGLFKARDVIVNVNFSGVEPIRTVINTLKSKRIRGLFQVR